MDGLDVSPREVLGVFVRWRKLIAFNVLTLMLISAVVSLVLPKKYTARTLIMPPAEQGVSLGLSAMLGAPGAGGFTSVARMAGLPGFGSTSDLFAGLLQTRTLLERVVRRCNLQDYYGLELMEEAIQALAGATETSVSLEGIISLTFTAGNRDLAARVANTYVAELDKINRNSTMTSGKAARIFIEGRLREVQQELEAAEESLRVFQERNKTISLEDEVVEAIRALAELQAEVISRDIQLGILSKFATSENPQVKRLRSEKRELERKLLELEQGLSGNPKDKRLGYGAGFGVPFARLPEVGMELARRTRDVEIETAVYTLLIQQYEEARIMEAKDTPTVQVVDRAVPPERRSFPVRKKIVVIGLALGLMGGVFLAFVLEYMDRIVQKPNERDAWAGLYRQLRSDLALLDKRVFGRRRR